MVFEKYKARKAATKALRTQSPKELELAYMKLCNPSPPSYDVISDQAAVDANAMADRNATSNGSNASMTVEMAGGLAPKPFVLRPPEAMRRHMERTAGVR